MFKTFAISTLGCKANQYDSRQIHTLLESLGLRAASADEKTDLAVVNTCCVTHTASSKSRQHIRKALRGTSGLVVCVGCLTNAPEQELNALGENIYLIKNRSAIAAELSRIVLNHYPNERQHQQSSPTNGSISAITPKKPAKSKAKNPSKLPQLPDLTAFFGQTRAFLKVQDGCDSYCTYCIIPKVRKDIVNSTLKSILSQAENLIASEHKEIVVTGINLGSYGRETTRKRKWTDNNTDYLAEMLDKLSHVKGLHRLRISSLNPQDVTEQLLSVLANRLNIMPHLHLSLQSGSNAVLKRMARLYSRELFIEKAAMLKSALDRPAITTDIIVGFPGETEKDFADSISLAEQVGFSRIHVFPFSVRKGTAAEKMGPKISPDVIKSRVRRLQELAKKLAYDFRQQFIGEKAQVLVENTDKNTARGLCERYFEVVISNSQNKIRKNDIVEVAIGKNDKNKAIAILFGT